MSINAARSELICRPAQALQAIRSGTMIAHSSLWNHITEADLTKLYNDLLPTAHCVWQLVMLDSDTLTRQEEKVIYADLFSVWMQNIIFITGSPYIGKQSNFQCSKVWASEKFASEHLFPSFAYPHFIIIYFIYRVQD